MNKNKQKNDNGMPEHSVQLYLQNMFLHTICLNATCILE